MSIDFEGDFVLQKMNELKHCNVITGTLTLGLSEDPELMCLPNLRRIEGSLVTHAKNPWYEHWGARMVSFPRLSYVGGNFH